MLTLNDLSPFPGSRKQKKRVGRGSGSGLAKTAGRGHKGFKARSGSGIKIGFEGGQMPLQRRLPKRGFNSIFKKEYAVVNLRALNGFAAGTRVDRQLLVEAGLVAGKDRLVKLLADGEIKHALNIVVDRVSEAARRKIEAVGGTVEEQGA